MINSDDFEEKIEKNGLTEETREYIGENTEELIDNFDNYDADVQDEILDNL